MPVHDTNSASTTTAAAVWDDALLTNPHAVADKRTRVQKMFAAIAPSYDLNNRLHSLWMDQRWRRTAVKLARLAPTDVVVDVACGTGDLTLHFAQRLRTLNEPDTFKRGQVVGLDFTYEMLPIAVDKAWSYRWATQFQKDFAADPVRLSEAIIYLNGDALALPLPDASADVLSIAFGIRNVADPAAAVREFHRVLRPGGRLIILEFSLPTNPLLRRLYNFYFRQVLPRTATLISRDKTGAYKYLPESVNTFISRDAMTRMMTDAGFTSVEQHPLTFGVCVCYRCVKA